MYKDHNDATPGARPPTRRAPTSYRDKKLPSHSTMVCHEEFVEHETDVRARWKRGASMQRDARTPQRPQAQRRSAMRSLSKQGPTCEWKYT